MIVTNTGLRTTVAPHWRRGLSYLKIGLRYLGSRNRQETSIHTDDVNRHDQNLIPTVTPTAKGVPGVTFLRDCAPSKYCVPNRFLKLIAALKSFFS